MYLHFSFLFRKTISALALDSDSPDISPSKCMADIAAVYLIAFFRDVMPFVGLRVPEINMADSGLTGLT